MLGEAVYTKALDNHALFAIPTYFDHAQPVVSGARVIGGLSVNFDSEKTCVTISQKQKDDFSISPPDHFYTIEVNATNVEASRWFTLEVDIDHSAVQVESRLTTLVSIASTTCERFRVGVRLFRANGSFEDLDMGFVQTANSGSWVHKNLSQPLRVLVGRLGEFPTGARLLFFADSTNKVSLSLAMLNALIGTD